MLFQRVKLLGKPLLGAFALALGLARPSTAEASSPYLVVPDPEVAERSPAYRYANMSDAEAFEELDKRKILYSKVDSVPGVRAPIRLTGRLHGVYIHSALPAEQRVTSIFEILDARLALALDDFAAVLERHDIDEVVHYTMYRPNVAKPSHDDGDRDEPPAKAEPPKADSARASSSKGVSTKSNPAPKAESLKVDSPKADSPKVDSPKADSPKATSPKSDSPRAALANPGARRRAASAPSKADPSKAVPARGGEAALEGKAALDRTLHGKKGSHEGAQGSKQKAPAAPDKATALVLKDTADTHKPATSHAPASAAGKAPWPAQKSQPQAAALPTKPSKHSLSSKSGSRASRRSGPVASARPAAHAPALHKTTWAPPGTRHPAGLAIDVGILHKRDGRWLNVAQHFQGHIGDRTCGEGVTFPEQPDAHELHSLVCEAFDLGIFTYVLTPNYNEAHADHFHMEIKGGVRWFLYH